MGYGRRVQASAVSGYANARQRRGFTLVETLIVIVLSTIVAGGIYNVLVFQQRYYRAERATTARHDALRLAAAVLTTDLIEATGEGGDLATIESDSVRVRSPVGFGIACVIDQSENKMGLINVAGRVSATAGDSALIYHPDGWLRRSIEEINPSSGMPLDCPYASGPAVEVRARVSDKLDGVPSGAPVRAFHLYTYRLEQSGGETWLVRDDGDVDAEPEMLAGPFSDDGSGLTFQYFDANGDPTSDASAVVRIQLTLVAEDPGATAERDTLRANVRLRNP